MSTDETVLILVRHAQPQRREAFLGHTGVALSLLGHHQASRCGFRLAGLQPATVFTSDLPRALETAGAIAAAGYPLTKTRLLRERSYGSWEGQTPAAVSRHDLDRYLRWRQTPHHVTPPGGETYEHMAGRVIRFARQLSVGTTIVVSHLGPLRTLVGILLRWPLPTTRALAIDHASVSVLSLSRRGNRAVLLNDTCHLTMPPV